MKDHQLMNYLISYHRYQCFSDQLLDVCCFELPLLDQPDKHLLGPMKSLGDS